MTRALQQRIYFLVLALFMAFHFAMTYARTLPMAFGSLRDFAYGPLDWPYRARILMRWVYAGGYHLTHDQAPNFVHGAMSAMQIVIFFIVLIAILLVIYLTRASIRLLAGRESGVQWLALGTVYMCCYQYLLIPDIRAQFPYDVPGVAAFAIGIYAILSNKRWLYYLTLIVGTFNRETTLFLIPVFFLFQLDASVGLIPGLKRLKKSLYLEAAAQLLLWAAIIHWCNVKTNAVLGPTFALPLNLRLLINPFHWPTFLSTYGFLWLPYVIYFRRIGDVRLQRIALLFPFWFAAMLWKADLLEIRVHAEWIPYLTICLALIARNSLQIRTGESVATPVAPIGVALV